MYFVYILICSDNSTYTGCTKDINQRLERHANGMVISTKNKLPVTLAFYCAFINKYKAFNFEKYLKSGSGRAFMRNRFL